MNLLFDQILSRQLPALLAVEYPRFEQVSAAGLATANDQALWADAAAHRLALVSKDADFARLAAAIGHRQRSTGSELASVPPRTW